MSMIKFLKDMSTFTDLTQLLRGILTPTQLKAVLHDAVDKFVDWLYS